MEEQTKAEYPEAELSEKDNLEKIKHIIKIILENEQFEQPFAPGKWEIGYAHNSRISNQRKRVYLFKVKITNDLIITYNYYINKVKLKPMAGLESYSMIGTNYLMLSYTG